MNENILKSIAIRNVYLNDRSDLERLISGHRDMFWSFNFDIDLNTLVAQNITHKTPNQTYCILFINNLIGFIHFYSYDENDKTVFMAYLLDKQYQGKGIMKDACLQIIPLIFENFAVNEIIVITSQRNEQSKNLIKKIGFNQTKHFQFKDKTFELYKLLKTYYSPNSLKLWHSAV